MKLFVRLLARGLIACAMVAQVDGDNAVTWRQMVEKKTHMRRAAHHAVDEQDTFLALASLDIG